MKRALVPFVLGALVAACGGANNGGGGWNGPTTDTVTPDLLAAFKEEAIGDPRKAEQMYVDLMDDAMYSSPWELAATEAAMDALVMRQARGLSDFSDRTALDYRTVDAAFFSPDKPEILAGRMPRIFRVQQDSIKKGIIARALVQLAEQRGSWADAERWRAATGCTREATILGPTSWTSITGIAGGKTPLDAFDAPLPSSFTTPGAFGHAEAPYTEHGHGCTIDLAATSRKTGTRQVVIDVDVRRAQTIAVGLRARGEATLRVGGIVAVTQPYELGSNEAVRWAKVDVDAGKVRLVATAGMNEDGDTIEIDAFTDEGDTLVGHAPKPGERANARASRAKSMDLPEPGNDAQRVTVALAALARGDARTAERTLENTVKSPNAPPEALLVYARAVESADDLSQVHRAERARAAYERVLQAWPSAWEAILAHGVLAGVRRGQSDARLETLKDIEAHRARATPDGQALIDAFEAATYGKERLYDRAAGAFGKARKGLDRTALLRDAEASVFPRSDADAVKYACSPTAPNDRSGFGCYSALHNAGDLKGSARELDRVRSLYGAPDKFATLAVRDALAAGDNARAHQAAASLLPGEWTLSLLTSLANDGKGRTDAPDQLKARLIALAPIARDSPNGLATLMGTLSSSVAKDFDKEAEEIAKTDHAHPLVEGAATAILKHVEKYDVGEHGVVHFTMFDLRRVNGTADVDENAQADPPDVDGRLAFRVVRKRIYKKDGRVLEPESAPNAAQSHADLAQLEQGDAIEAVYDGWAIPGETGNIGIDTPDLLPDRTAVADASIEIRLPAALKVSMWHHPLLGDASESKDGNARVLKWTLAKHGARHVEAGTPKMDRSVGVSLSTMTWSTVAVALRETQASLVDSDPEVAGWAREAAGLKPGAKAKSDGALVEAIVRAAGVTVHEASPGVLSDFGAGGARGPQTMTARTILTDHEGSRTWLIVRALRGLGVKTDIVVAENVPFSADPAFPPHFGRFVHPLAIAHVVSDKGAPQELWIDADVQGPPLPAGHISPELRGRAAMHEDGTISAVPNLSTDERDEIDIRLVVDESGSAKGDVTALLRGRAAQEIAEALTRVVGFERERMLRNVILGWVPYASVNEVALSSSEGSWQVALRASITVSGYAQAETTTGKAPQTTWILPGLDPVHWVFPRPAVASLVSTYAAERTRESTLAIAHAIQYHAHRRIELPSGTKVSRLPGPFDVSAVSLGAARSIAVNKSTIEDDFTLNVPTGTIAPLDYATFADAARRTDDAFMASTRVLPTK